MTNFNDAVFIHSDWERDYYDDRYLVESRMVTIVSESAIYVGAKQVNIFDLGLPPDQPDIGLDISIPPPIPEDVSGPSPELTASPRTTDSPQTDEMSHADYFSLMNKRGKIVNDFMENGSATVPLSYGLSDTSSIFDSSPKYVIYRIYTADTYDFSGSLNSQNAFNFPLDLVEVKKEVSSSELPPEIHPHDGTLYYRSFGEKKGLHVGGNGTAGALCIINLNNDATIQLDGASANVTLGGPGTDGDLILRNVNDDATIQLDGAAANVTLGGPGTDGDIILKNDDDNVTIHLDGNAGDIILSNADCAEEFDVANESEEVEPGSVMVLMESGEVAVSREAYDKKVAGIVSGAGDYKPGIVLDRQPSECIRQPIALMGKVFCKVDATFGAIEVGDLLTTSPTTGHAMKADDPLKAFGAVIGKALRAFPDGRGLIPVLVALQ